MTAVEFEPAYLLQQRPYRETSCLLEVISADHGRVGLVARGVRGKKSKLRGVLQPFRPLLLSWRRRGELGTLIWAESDGQPVALRGERVFHGWYLNELLLKLVQRDDPHAGLFSLYARSLSALSGEHGEAGLRLFEKRLLELIGYGLDLPDTLNSNGHYRYDPEAGPERCEAATPGAVSGAVLIALREERFEASELRLPLRRLLREAIDRQLGGRELESRRMLLAMRAGMRKPE